MGEQGIVVEEFEEVTGECFATLLTLMDTFLNFLGGSLISFKFFIITSSIFLSDFCSSVVQNSPSITPSEFISGIDSTIKATVAFLAVSDPFSTLPKEDNDSDSKALVFASLAVTCRGIDGFCDCTAIVTASTDSVDCSIGDDCNNDNSGAFATALVVASCGGVDDFCNCTAITVGSIDFGNGRKDENCNDDDLAALKSASVVGTCGSINKDGD